MRLPDDFNEHNSGWSPTVFSTLISVSLVVGAILVLVLLTNNQNKHGGASLKPENASAEPESVQEIIQERPDNSYPNTDSIVSGSTLSPEDLDFWDKYPKETAESQKPSEAETTETEPVAENDPSTDGKHTMVVNREGDEEWVLISPYLPKHEYDFTKLVCQSQIMKYYENGRQVSFVGAEISKYQDYVDFVKLKKAGIDFVMLRVGVRGYGSGQLVADEAFSDNIKRAVDSGLQVGVYFTSQAVSKEEVMEEAALVLESIRDYKLGYPVAFEMGFVENDTARIESLSKAEKTDIAKTFLDTIAAEGYKTAIRGDKEWLIKEIDMSKLTAYDVWLSQIQDVPDYPYRFTMWQYTADASVDGVVGYVKLNISFIDYSEK